MPNVKIFRPSRPFLFLTGVLISSVSTTQPLLPSSPLSLTPPCLGKRPLARTQFLAEASVPPVPARLPLSLHITPFPPPSIFLYFLISRSLFPVPLCVHPFPTLSPVHPALLPLPLSGICLLEFAPLTRVSCHLFFCCVRSLFSVHSRGWKTCFLLFLCVPPFDSWISLPADIQCRVLLPPRRSVEQF